MSESSAISRMLRREALPTDIQDEVVDVAVRDGLAVHAKLGAMSIT